MKIKTFQTGGIVYLPTSSNSGEAVQQNTASSSKTSEFTKSLFDLLKTKGLDSDMSQLMNKIQMTLDLAGDPNGDHLTARDFLSIAQMATSATNNYADYEKARATLTTNNAWGEVATTNAGNLYAVNANGNLTTISPTEYTKNTNKYMPLTFGDLLNYRRQSSSLAFNNGVLDDVSGAIGMDTVLSDVNTIIKNYKETEVTGYAVKQGKNILSGMQEIVNSSLAGNNASTLIATGPDGIYKITEKGTEADKDLKTALNYIISALPQKDKRYLYAQAAVNKFDPHAFLLQTIINGTGRSITPSYEKQASGTSGSGSEGGASGLIQGAVPEMYATGEGAPAPQRIPIYTGGSTTALSVYGQNMGPVAYDRSGNLGQAMSNVSVAQLLEQAHGIRQVGTDTVVFGDQVINRNQLDGIMYDGSNMYRVVLPAKTAENGRDVIPDFEVIKKVENVVKNGKEKGEDASVINRYLQEVCPGAIYDESTGLVKYPESRSRAFLTFGGVASSKAIDFTPSDYMASADELLQDDMPSLDAYIEMGQYGSVNHAKNADKRNTSDIGTGFLGLKRGAIKRNLYKANVYIPISDAVIGASLYNPEYRFKTDYTNITGRDVARQQAMYAQEKLSDPTNTNW